MLWFSAGVVQGCGAILDGRPIAVAWYTFIACFHVYFLSLSSRRWRRAGDELALLQRIEDEQIRRSRA